LLFAKLNLNHRPQKRSISANWIGGAVVEILAGFNHPWAQVCTVVPADNYRLARLELEAQL